MIFCFAAILACSTSAAESVRIAFIDPLSGPFANTGYSALQHFRAAVDRDEFKQRLGARRIEIVPFDNAAGVVESITQLRSAVDRNIRFVVQGQSSAVALALVDAIEKHNSRDPARSVLFLNYAALDPDLTGTKCSFWHFRFDAPVEMRLRALLEASIPPNAWRSVYLINQDYSFGRHVAQSAKDWLPRISPRSRIAGEVLHPLGSVKDFAPYVFRAKSSGADTILTANWGADLALLVKAAREMGFEGRILTFFAGAPGAVSAMGSRVGPGRLTQVNEWHANAEVKDGKAMARYTARFLRNYGEEFRYLRILTLTDMLAEAFAKHVNATPRDIAFALEGMRINTPTGAVEMRAQDHQLLQPLFVSTLHLTAKSGGAPDLVFETESSGMGFRTDKRIEAGATAAGSTCAMVRPLKN